jgi:pilus assembly protein CpaB
MDRRRILLVFAALIAALGTLLVFLYVKGADTRANEAVDSQDILTAVSLIAPGESVDAAAAAGKFELRPIAANSVLAGALVDTSAITGKVATTTIYPGEQIIASKFGGAAESSALPIPKGKLAISVNLSDPARVAGFVSPGSEVTIFMTGSSTTGTIGPFARMLLPRVTVIGVGSTTPGQTTTTTTDGTATTEVLPNALLTLAVSKEDAERVLFASTNGALAFGLLTKDSETPKGQGVTDRNLFP